MRHSVRPRWLARLIGSVRGQRRPENAGATREFSGSPVRPGPPAGPIPTRPLYQPRPWVPPTEANRAPNSAPMPEAESTSTRPIITQSPDQGRATPARRGRTALKRPSWLALGLAAAVLIAL